MAKLNSKEWKNYALTKKNKLGKNTQCESDTVPYHPYIPTFNFTIFYPYSF